MNSIDLTGKTAIITGAGQGLGRAIAEQLHQANAYVVVNYVQLKGEEQNRQKAEEVVGILGERAVAIEADIRDPASVKKIFNQTESLCGKIDIVVNNAGITRDAVAKNMTMEKWQQVLDTNLTGSFLVCQQASNQLANNGRIVNISSLSAFLGTFGQANYAASKAGVTALGKVLSRELARRNITVNTVAPGLILTEMGQATPEKVQQDMLQQIPLGRFGEPEEVAGVVLFLCSELASLRDWSNDSCERWVVLALEQLGTIHHSR